MWEVGTRLRVLLDVEHFAGREGIFEFMGGPDEDVVVLSDPENDRLIFCVAPEDVIDV